MVRRFAEWKGSVMDSLDADRLVAACADDGFDAGVSVVAELEPLAGAGAPVKPAVYEGGAYQLDRRWWGEGEDRRVVDVVVIDNVASEANRLEAALRERRVELGLPELVLDLSGLGLPVHLPSSISSFQFPHRNADAYLRDALLGGVKFPARDTGRALFEATATNPAALFQWMPQALLFGFWQSHLGKKRQQTKLARSWVSEIIGVEPATVDTTSRGLKGDPLNLSIDDAVSYVAEDQLDWDVLEAGKAGKAKSKDSLSEIGHGQVPVAGAPAGVSFRVLHQQSTVSFAGLSRIHAATPEASAAGRALLAAIGLAGQGGAFGRAFSLRSGCDLRPVASTWTWLGEQSDHEVQVPSMEECVELVASCAQRAEAAGLPVGSAWQSDPLVLLPQPNLAKVIEKSYPLDRDS